MKKARLIEKIRRESQQQNPDSGDVFKLLVTIVKAYRQHRMGIQNAAQMVSDTFGILSRKTVLDALAQATTGDPIGRTDQKDKHRASLQIALRMLKAGECKSLEASRAISPRQRITRKPTPAHVR